ncbi:MAG: flagellar hook protein FlgE [Sphingomonadales bacterium]|nr:flagellar hook protein FlgE [Sphingomonadales bacterium]
MGIFAALFSGVSGLQTYGDALGILADNITNVNTVGYKESRARFTTLVTESSSSSSFSPGGVGLVSQTLIGKQGLLQASTSATDLSIDGAGFFVVRNSPQAQDSSGEILFSRAGSFTPDAEGFLQNTAGHFLMGWPVDSQGQIPSNLGSLDSLVPINTAGLTGTAEATDLVKLRANLQSSQSVSALEATYVPTVSATNMASGTVKPDFERTVQVFDGQGGAHTLTLAMLKSDVNNEWHVEVFADPAADVTPIAPLIDGQVGTGLLRFNPDGSLDLTAGTGTSASLLSGFPINWTTGAASSDISIDWGSDSDVDGITQFDSISALISSNVNGAIFGNVTGVAVGKDGAVTALFDNGLTREVFKLPLATFQNPNGLNRRQGNAYGVSDLSGNFSMVEAGTGGGGSVAPGQLEASTVDLAGEFTQLITTQRAFSASTKVITTADEMLDELTRIKR